MTVFYDATLLSVLFILKFLVFQGKQNYACLSTYMGIDLGGGVTIYFTLIFDCYWMWWWLVAYLLE